MELEVPSRVTVVCLYTVLELEELIYKRPEEAIEVSIFFRARNDQ